MKTDQRLPHGPIPQTKLEWELFRMIHGPLLSDPYHSAYLQWLNPAKAQDPVPQTEEEIEEAIRLKEARRQLAIIARDETDRFTVEQKLDAIEHDAYLAGDLPRKHTLIIHRLYAKMFLLKCGMGEGESKNPRL